MALGLWRASAYGSCSLRLLPLVLVLLCQGEGAGLFPGFVAPGLRAGEGRRFALTADRDRGHGPDRWCRTGNLLTLCSAPRAGGVGGDDRPKGLQRDAPAAGARAASTTSKGDAGRAQEGGEGPAYFPQLSQFDTVDKLLDAITPYLDEDSRGQALLTGRNAAHVMNKLKSMSRNNARSELPVRANDKAERRRVEQVRDRLMGIVSEKMDELALKHIALVLNAVKGRRGSTEAQLVKAACLRALELLEEEAHVDRVSAVDAQTVAMLVNSLAMGTGGLSAASSSSRVVKESAEGRTEDPRGADGTEVVQLVFEASARVLLAMPPERFDAQSISTTMNAFASAERWEVALFRRLGRIAVGLGPERFSLQPVAMVMNAYSRLMQQEKVLSPWDVEEVDAVVFQGMSKTTTYVARRLTHPPPSTAQSVALIVNALAKVGVADKEVFTSVSQLLKRAGKGKDKLQYDAQAVSNIVNAFAKANVEDEELFTELAEVAMRLPMNSFTGQHVATILNGYSRAGVAHVELFEFMSSLVRYWDRFGQLTPARFAPQTVALVLNAFARAKIEDRELFERMARLVQMHLHSPADGPLQLLPSSGDRPDSQVISQPQWGADSKLRMSPQAVSNIVNACANGNFGAPELLKTLERTIMLFDGREMTLQHVSCIANGLVRLGHAPPHLLAHLTKLARNMSMPSSGDASGPLSLALLANALCKTEVYDVDTLRWIGVQARGYAGRAFSAQSVAMLANAFARANCRDHALFRQLCDVCMNLPAEAFDEQSIGNIANAFARNSESWTKHANAAPGSYKRLLRLFERLADIATSPPMLTTFSSQSVALMVSAYAKLGIKDPELFDRLSKVAQQMGSRNFELPCKPLHVAQVCNAFAKLQIYDEALFRRMTELLQEQPASQFDSRLIGIIFNAYAQLRIRDLALLERLSLVSRSMPSSSFDAQAIGNIFHALATLNVRDDALIDHMATTILRSRQTIMQTEDYNGQALANIAWSMAVLQLSDVALNRWICRMCARSIASMDTNALCQLHQYILAHEVEGLVKPEKLPELEELLKHRGAMQRAWQTHQRNLMSSRNRAQALRSRAASLVDEAIVQEAARRTMASLFQQNGGDTGVDRAWSADGGGVHGDSSQGSSVMQAEAANESIGISNLQRDVGTTLSGMLKGHCLSAAASYAPSETLSDYLGSVNAASGVRQGGQPCLELLDLIPSVNGAEQAMVHEEVTENITGYSLDMIVPGTALVVEVDGPSHYARASRIALGSTEMKRRQLKAVGYRLCSVAFWQWPSGSSTEDKEHVLRSVLAPHIKGMQLPSRSRWSVRTRAETEGQAEDSVAQARDFFLFLHSTPSRGPHHEGTKPHAAASTAPGLPLASVLHREPGATVDKGANVTGPTPHPSRAPHPPAASAALLPKPFRVGSPIGKLNNARSRSSAPGTKPQQW